MSIRDTLFGPNAATGSVEAPGASALSATRREAIPTSAGGGFSTAVERLLGREGGYSNDAVDRGGATNFGISSRSYPDLDVSKLTRDQAAQIYKRDYWDAIEADKLPEATREIAFDSAVNHGVGRTRQLLAETGGDPGRLIDARRKLYNDIVAKDPSQQKFHRGWMNRLDGLSGGKAISSVEEFGSGGGEFPMPSSEPRQRSAAWQSIMGSDLQQAIPEGEVTGGDYGRALAISGGDFAKAPVAALENMAGQLASDGSTPTERRLADSQRGLADVRRGIGEWQKGLFEGMNPEAIDRAQRELLTLDPSKTMWQGGAKEFMSSVALKGTLSLAPTIGPMVTTALLGRLGVGASASTLWGAQEGLISAGLTAAQIADEIEQTPMDELRKIDRFNELESQLGEAEAKRQYVNEVQGVVPAVTGILVGSIAKAVGKPLDKVFGAGEGLPFAGRVAAGAFSETAQEGPQSFVEQVMQNYAKMAYDSNLNLLDGAAEATVQGMLLGGIMGGTFAGMFGNRPRKGPMSSDPVPSDIRAAIGGVGAAATPAAAGPSPATGGAPPATGGEPPGAPPPGGGGGDLSLAPEPPTVTDRFATPEQNVDPSAIPFEPSILPTPDTLQPDASPDTIDFPQPEAAQRGRRKKVTAPRGAIPLTLAEAESPAPTDLDMSLAPVEPAVQSAVQTFEPRAGDTIEPDFLPPAPPAEAEPTMGTTPIEANQRREPKYGTRTRTEMLGYRVRVRGANGELLSSQLVDGKATAKIIAKQAEKKLAPGQFVEMLPARRTFQNEQTPTAEPVSDIVAQTKAMQAGDPERNGVYITRETLDNLREAGQLDEVLRSGVPIKNFDTYGGIMLARDEATAQELMQFIEDPQSNIDEVIGYATGAGNGKPGGKNPVVQLLDDDGNVIRERQVTPEEGPALKAQWGPMARLMPLEQALAIRQNRMQREKAERGVANEQQAFDATNPPQQVAELFGENQMTAPFAEEAEARAKQGGFEEDIGARLFEMARDTRAEEKKRRRIDKRIPAPEDVKFRGRELVERSREATRLRRAGKKEEADKIVSSLAGQSKQRGDLSAAYKELNDKLLVAALRIEQAQSVQDVTDAQADYDRLIDEMKAFYDVEGGYTKAEAVARAASRYSPKARKEALASAAKARGERQAAADKKEEEQADITRPARLRPGRILAVGDEPREEKNLQRIKQAARVSVETTASQLSQVAKRIKTPEGKRLVENLFMLLSPTVGADLDQIMDQIDATEAVARLDKLRAAGKLSDKRYAWRKKLAEARAEKESVKARTATATALIEINQLLRQWLSDYRLALMQSVSAETGMKARNAVHAVRAAEVSEMLGNLRAYHQGDIGIADEAARTIAYRISAFVVHGKRRGVAAEMDIDGFWNAIAKGPMAFRDYLSDTVQSREDLPFPADLTMEQLEGASLGKLNALYVKALEFLDGSRESDGQRREMVRAIKQAVYDRGLKLSDKPETIKVRLWDRYKHDYVTVERTISPRKLFAETFRRSYGMKGADSRMSMEQLKDLYLKGEFTELASEARYRRDAESRDFETANGLTGMRRVRRKVNKLTVWADGYVTFNDDEHPNPEQAKGKETTIELKPLGAKLPEALPLNVRARRIPPEKKRRTILRASRAMDKKQYGGKATSTGLTRTSKSDSARARAETKYNTGVLLEDTAPRDLGSKSEEYAQRKESSAEVLTDALSNAEAYLADMETAKYKKAVGDPQGYIHAKAYIRWVYEYGASLSQAKLKSWAAIREKERVAGDLTLLTKLQPENLVAEIDSRFRAEMNEQIFRAVALDPVNLKGLRDPTKRAKMMKESHDRLRKIIVFHKRLTELWQNHPIFLQDIQPVLNKISESISARHRGIQERGGWSIVPFTDAERATVTAIMKEWKNARDLPLMAKGKLFQAWGVPADALHDDFYMPLHEMLTSAGFFNPDEALAKVYSRRFTTEEDRSTGAVAIIGTGENWKGQTETTLRYAPVEADPATLAASALEKRKQEVRDRELAAMDDDEAEELNEGEQKRRKKLISSPLGKTATSARKLLRANDMFVQFHKVLYNPDANVRQIAQAEQLLLANLRETGLLTDGAEAGTYILGIPDTAPVIKQLEEELAELKAAEGNLNSDDESATGPDTAEITRIAGEIQQSMSALESIRELQLGNKRAGRITYKVVGPRLTSGELTKEAARLEAGSKITGFKVKAPKAERLGETRAKTRGDKLKERAKAAAEEKKRREGMTYEQRKAAESYDRLGYGDLKFDLSTAQGSYGEPTRADYETFYALRDRLAAAGSAPLGELLAFVSDKLGGDHTYQPIIRTLMKHAAHRRVPVRFSQDLDADNTGKLALEGDAPVILLNEQSYMEPGFNPLRAIHVLLHEAVHAATVRAMLKNQPSTDALNMIRQLAQTQLGGKFQYATSDVFEFVAEAYTNAEFQAALKAITVESVKNTTLWNKFVTWVQNLLGFAPEYANLLDAVISLQNTTFGPEPYDRTSARKIKEFDFKDEAINSLANSAFAQHEAVQDAMRRASSLGDRIKEGGQEFLLKALSMRQLAQFYSNFFGADNNPFLKYMDAFEKRNSYASTLLEEADKLSRRWTAIEEGKKEQGVELSRIMHEATTTGEHADDPKSPLHMRFQALTPEAQQLYKDVREYYKETQKREVQLMLANALRASKLWTGGQIEAEDIDLEGITKGDWLQQKLGIDVKKLKLKLAADAKTLDKKAYKAREADLDNTIEEMKLIARMASIPSMNEGPYFPLMRFGDYAVKAERVKATEVYATRKERTEAMDAWHAKDPTLQFNFPKTDDEGSFPLTVSEVEFRLAETRAEATAARVEMVAEYGDHSVTPVQLKRDLINDGATISGNRALQTLLGKLDGNAAAQAALREFYIKSLSDRSFRKREARRKNVRGADPTKQHRTFGAYSKSASYYTSQLKYGHVMADAKAEMDKTVEAHRDESRISAVRMGQIVNEIKIRDKQAATLTDVSPIVRGAVETGQLWLLLSPSYWMINATQPYMVTLPWLAGRSSLPQASKALAEAQALIIDPLVTQGARSWGGLKAIKSRLAAEEAFSVLENVEKSLQKKLGADAQPVLDMLTALKRESIIDLSFVAELRDIAEGQDKSAWGKVMDASRVLAHLTEVNNRIMTAIAAYNIAKEQGLDERTATDFAKRAVAETQFDYSAANKPRLFSANDAWWKPLVFQFMQYVQHMYVLFARHAGMWWKAPRGSKEAQIGRRVVLGLLSTHFAAGGLLGATPQLAKWGIGLMMMLFGAGDDDDQTFKNLASGEYYNRMMTDAVSWLAGDGKLSETVRGGLPRLAGFDLSSRTALLQTYMIDLDTKTSETLYGSLVSTFGGPMFGIAGNVFDAAQLALEGDSDKAWEKLLPKLGRDAVRASRYWREGLVDHSGKTILRGEEMSPWEIFLTGMGFQPSQIAETYTRNNRARESEAFVSERKAEIMAAYRKTRSTGENSAVMADLREFNKQFPQDRITLSQLIRGSRAMRKAEMNIQRYGVDAGRRSREYTDDSYNVE